MTIAAVVAAPEPLQSSKLSVPDQTAATGAEEQIVKTAAAVATAVKRTKSRTNGPFIR